MISEVEAVLTVLGLSLLVFCLVFVLLGSGLLLGRQGITGTCSSAASRSSNIDPCGACSPLRRTLCKGRRMLAGGR